MKLEYEKMKKNSSIQSLEGSDVLEEDDFLDMPLRATIKPFSPYDVYSDTLINPEAKFFGYNFFTKRDTVAFWENLPTPKNYLLGPGDELIISIWGQTQLRKTYTISREGNIYDDKVGLLNLMGKTLGEAEKYLSMQFGKVYSTIKGSSPTTFMDVSLGKLSSINVNFVGELKL